VESHTQTAYVWYKSQLCSCLYLLVINVLHSNGLQRELRILLHSSFAVSILTIETVFSRGAWSALWLESVGQIRTFCAAILGCTLWWQFSDQALPHWVQDLQRWVCMLTPATNNGGKERTPAGCSQSTLGLQLNLYKFTSSVWHCITFYHSQKNTSLQQDFF
jgi:hypothetical protein